MHDSLPIDTATTWCVWSHREPFFHGLFQHGPQARARHDFILIRPGCVLGLGSGVGLRSGFEVLVTMIWPCRVLCFVHFQQSDEDVTALLL